MSPGRFVPIKGERARAALADVMKRGKIAVSRRGVNLRIRTYVPEVRGGVEGVVVRELERPATGPVPDHAAIAASRRSFDKGAAITVDENWRRDLGVRHLHRGALAGLLRADGLDEVTVFDRALAGAVDSLNVERGPLRDRWNQHYDPAAKAALARATANGQVQLGAAIRKVRGRLRIERVTPTSPAARAGLRRGDVPLSIAGEPVTIATWGTLLARTGERPFELVFARGDDVRKVVVQRAPVRWPLRTMRTREGMAVFRFNDGFDVGLAGQISQALVAFDAERPLRGIVLDLRDNGGGNRVESIAILDELVTRGQLVVDLQGSGKRVVTVASGKGRFAHLPVAVLVNGGSASASELVPNSLRHLAAERGAGVVIVGDPTYGKGLGQQTFALERGAIKLSTRRFVNGALESTQGKPLIPDISTAEASRRQRLANPGKRVVDPVLREAIAELDRMARRPDKR